MLCRRFRAFFVAFWLTLLLAATTMGLAAVDLAALQDGFGGLTTFSVEYEDGLTLVIEGPAKTRVVDLTLLNELEAWRRRYDVFTLPRSVRLAARWLTAGRLWLAQLGEARRAPEYYENAGLV